MTAALGNESAYPDLCTSSAAALVRKYDIAGPRYTSYPTALQFTDSFGASDYTREVLANASASIAPLSLYVHIPFCRDICYYCACNKLVSRDPTAITTYLGYLQREIGLQAALFNRHRPVLQLHLGGGTPTVLSHAELTQLVLMLSSRFRMVDLPSREYSIEIDPRSASAETIALLKGLGFNRLSFGVQDFNPAVQAAVHRPQSLDLVQDLTDAARAHDFRSLNYDMIYGLPHQTLATLQNTLDQLIELSPDRIAYYSYAHLPQRFSNQRAIDRQTLPDAETKLAMHQLIIERLVNAGYEYLGMDHFVRPSDELAIARREGRLQRNFQGYSLSLAPDLVGLGLSAIGSLRDCYAQNASTLDDYYARLDRGEVPIARGIRLTSDDELRRFVIMSLICNLALDTGLIRPRFGVCFFDYFAPEVQALAELECDGLVTWDSGWLQVTPLGRRLLRKVCMVFDRYLVNDAKLVYSRII